MFRWNTSTSWFNNPFIWFRWLIMENHGYHQHHKWIFRGYVSTWLPSFPGTHHFDLTMHRWCFRAMPWALPYINAFLACRGETLQNVNRAPLFKCCTSLQGSGGCAAGPETMCDTMSTWFQLPMKITCPLCFQILNNPMKTRSIYHHVSPINHSYWTYKLVLKWAMELVN